MHPKNAMVEYRLTNWAKMIHERDCSGMSIRTYCENIGIAEHVYYYRLKKVREAACAELSGAQGGTSGISSEMFTEVDFSEPTPSSANILRNHVCFEVSGLRLTAGSEYPIDKLTELMRVASCL